VLARRNRITRGADYKATLRRGRRIRARHVIVSVEVRPQGEPARFGFIVSRNVGGAVVRNLVRRRLKAICRQRLLDIPSCDVVIRALPASSGASWDTLVAETVHAVHQGLSSS
jgi:ribonuclease P protein component